MGCTFPSSLFHIFTFWIIHEIFYWKLRNFIPPIFSLFKLFFISLFFKMLHYSKYTLHTTRYLPCKTDVIITLKGLVKFAESNIRCEYFMKCINKMYKFRFPAHSTSIYIGMNYIGTCTSGAIFSTRNTLHNNLILRKLFHSIIQLINYYDGWKKKYW